MVPEKARLTPDRNVAPNIRDILGTFSNVYRGKSSVLLQPHPSTI